MLYDDRIYVSEEIDVSKTSKWKECDICCYWYFSNNGFKFQTYACNRCHALLIIYMNLHYIAILKTKNADYHCIIAGISKSEAITIM